MRGEVSFSFLAQCMAVWRRHWSLNVFVMKAAI
jgi:hypothetical protein